MKKHISSLIYLHNGFFINIGITTLAVLIYSVLCHKGYICQMHKIQIFENCINPIMLIFVWRFC